MRFVFFKGQSGYDAFSHFCDQLANALIATGAIVHKVDLADPHFQLDWSHLFDQGIDVCLGFNATALDITTSGINLYDGAGLPFIGLLVDHPLHLQRRLQTPMANLIVGTVDHAHGYSLNRICGLYRPHFHFPLAATLDTHEKIYLPWNSQDRDIFCLCPFSLEDLSSLTYGNLSTAEMSLMDNLEKGLLTSACLSFDELFIELCQSTKGLSFSHTPSLLYRKLLPSLAILDRKLRAKERLSLVQTLAEKGVRPHVLGRGWDQIQLPSSITYLGECSFNEQLELFKRSACVMHCAPVTFDSPTHDRLLNASLRGALVIHNCAKSKIPLLPYLNEFRYDRFSALQAHEKLLLAHKNPTNTQKLIEQTQKEILSKHLWKHRAQSLLTELESLIPSLA